MAFQCGWICGRFPRIRGIFLCGDHGGEALRVEGDLDEVAEVAHGQVAHRAAGVEYRLVHSCVVELFGHMEVHPEDLGALDALGIARLGEVHGGLR